MTQKEVTKKFVNDPHMIVEDALHGIANYNRNVSLSKNCPRVLLRPHDKNKVSIIAGGGSGHEPYAAGYVGTGMLTAAVVGNLFASPPTRHVQTALEETRSKVGTIVILINYTGDRLNFGLAIERFAAQGNDVRLLTVQDDVSIGKNTNTGSRGLAGAVLLTKIVGAMAENGDSLSDIEDIGRYLIPRLHTIGCALAPCSMPGRGPMVDIPADQYELGLGIHGEAGKERIGMESAKNVINRLVGKLISNFSRDGKMVVLLNNLGGVSQIEMMLLQGEILRWCVENNITLLRLYSGTYMTSLDCHGISISMLNVSLNVNLLGYLDAETKCSGWNSGIVLKPDMSLPLVLGQPAEKVKKVESYVDTEKEVPNLKNVVVAVCTEMCLREDELNALDSGVGDGDCGSTFRSAADLVIKMLDNGELCLYSVQKLMEQMATLFEENIGGTTGALYAIMFSVAAQHVAAFSPQNLRRGFTAAADAVEKYGHAREGDRTLIDTMRSAANMPGTDWKKAVCAAEDGARSTAKMSAGAGRASYTSSKVQNIPDAGAMALAYWMSVILKESDY